MAKGKNKTQKGQELPDMTEDQARAHLEKLRWPNGLVCIRCGSIAAYKLGGKATRPGLIKCRDCKQQFTVTVDTIFEDSHIPLAKWVKAFHLMTSSKKGISALQLQRNLGLGSYRSAWHLAHRIRYAMKSGTTIEMLKGEVQVDETYVGADHHGKVVYGDRPRKTRGRGTDKTPVVALVETHGNVRSMPVARVNTANLKAEIEKHVDRSATIVTDELSVYPKAAAGHAAHRTVSHGHGEYVNADGFTTNTAESFFALLKRGVYGTFHHVSKKHLHRYCDEFSFRWNGRDVTDAERRTMALMQTEGKRLMYRAPRGEA